MYSADTCVCSICMYVLLVSHEYDLGLHRIYKVVYTADLGLCAHLFAREKKLSALMIGRAAAEKQGRSGDKKRGCSASGARPDECQDIRTRKASMLCAWVCVPCDASGERPVSMQRNKQMVKYWAKKKCSFRRRLRLGWTADTYELSWMCGLLQITIRIEYISMSCGCKYSSNMQYSYRNSLVTLK